jgi:hypothetical protein
MRASVDVNVKRDPERLACSLMTMIAATTLVMPAVLFAPRLALLDTVSGVVVSLCLLHQPRR